MNTTWTRAALAVALFTQLVGQVSAQSRPNQSWYFRSDAQRINAAVPGFTVGLNNASAPALWDNQNTLLLTAPQAFLASANGVAQLSGTLNGNAIVQIGGAATRTDERMVATLWTINRTSVPRLSTYNYQTTVSTLHPSGALQSAINGISTTQQAGFFYSAAGQLRAALWNGTASSFIDLHPTIVPLIESVANGVANGVQVGGVRYPSRVWHAVRWQGTAASAIDIHPLAFYESVLTCTNGTQHGGYARALATSPNEDAYLWTGTSPNGTILTPLGFQSARVNALAAGVQVGWGTRFNSVNEVALAWYGSSRQFIDLHQLLPRVSPANLPIQFVRSRATAVLPDGTIYGQAQDTTGRWYAIIWYSFVPPFNP